VFIVLIYIVATIYVLEHSIFGGKMDSRWGGISVGVAHTEWSEVCRTVSERVQSRIVDFKIFFSLL